MKKLIVAMIMLLSISAYALTGYLQSSTVNGQWRYCQYSDGRVLTIPAVQLCPLSIQ